MKKRLFLLGILCFSFSPFFSVFAQKLPTLDFYYSLTCPHCHNEMEWFPELKEMFPDIQIKKTVVNGDKKAQTEFLERLKSLDHEFLGVPTNIIEDQVIVGFDPQKIIKTLTEKYGEPQKTIKDGESQKTIEKEESKVVKWESFLNYSWPIMGFTLGILDGFNPCAMWSLLILLGFLLTIESKKKRWLIGSVFLASSGILYFGALLTYLLGFAKVSQIASSEFMVYVFRAVGVLAIVTGIFSLKKSAKNEVDCDVRDAESKKTFSKKLTEILDQKNTWLLLIGVIGLAFSVNSIELVCSFAIPTAFTASLVSLEIPFWQQIAAISIYDFAYMLDDLIVFLIAMWTLNLKLFSARAVQISHFIGGGILILLGGLLVVNPELLSKIFN